MNLNELRDRVLDVFGPDAITGDTHVGYTPAGAPFIRTDTSTYTQLDGLLVASRRTAGHNSTVVTDEHGNQQTLVLPPALPEAN